MKGRDRNHLCSCGCGRKAKRCFKRKFDEAMAENAENKRKLVETGAKLTAIHDELKKLHDEADRRVWLEVQRQALVKTQQLLAAALKEK